MKTLNELCIIHDMTNIDIINDGWLRKFKSTEELIRTWATAIERVFTHTHFVDQYSISRCFY